LGRRFFSAEGTFGVRANGTKFFGVCQAHNSSLISAIGLFFGLSVKVTSSLAKSGKTIYQIMGQSRASFLTAIAFFDSTPINLGGQKYLQYLAWREHILGNK
jgi:hypothetical protein